MPITGTHHVALLTTNFAQLRDFYVNTLGLRPVGAFPGGKIIFLDAGSTTIELIARDTLDQSVAGHWAHFAFEVDDLDALYEQLAAQGVPFHTLPKDVPPEAPSARIAFFRDPDGNELELFQPLVGKYPQA